MRTLDIKNGLVQYRLSGDCLFKCGRKKKYCGEYPNPTSPKSVPPA